MPMALVLRFADGRREAVEVPEGQQPETLAEELGASVFDLCGSLSEARYKIESDPTGIAS